MAGNQGRPRPLRNPPRRRGGGGAGTCLSIPCSGGSAQPSGSRPGRSRARARAAGRRRPGSCSPTSGPSVSAGGQASWPQRWGGRAATCPGQQGAGPRAPRRTRPRSSGGVGDASNLLTFDTPSTFRPLSCVCVGGSAGAWMRLLGPFRLRACPASAAWMRACVG